MGTLFQQDEILELDGFPLEDGDQMEILLAGFWVSGTVTRSVGGWSLQTRERVTIALRTGLPARLLSLSSQTLPQTDARLNTLGNTSPRFGRSTTATLSNRELADNQTTIPVLRKYALVAVPDVLQEE